MKVFSGFSFTLPRVMAEFLSGALILLLLNGCSAGKNGLIQEDAKSEAPVLPKVEDYPVPELGDYNLDIRLANEQIDSALMLMEPLPLVRFTIWAYDEMAADAAATKIKLEEFALRPQAVAYPLRFNHDDLQAIELLSNNDEAVRYYMSLEVDIDRDGIACNGDLRQDFSVSGPEFYSLSQATVDREITIAAIEKEDCEPTDAS